MPVNDGFERRTLCVALAPERLSAVVRGAGQILACSEIRIGAGRGERHWEDGLAAFAAWVERAGAGLRGVPLSVSVSTRWCQLAMLPWSDALLYPDSAWRYRQERFVHLYGNLARGWEVFCDDAARGQPRLACAIERQFADGLRVAAQAQGYAGIGIESVLTAAARAMPAAPYDRFAIIEPGRLVLAARRHGRIAAVEAQACAGSWLAALPPAWQHGLLRAPELGEVVQVALFGGADPASAAGAPQGLVSAAGSWHTETDPTHFARSFHDLPEDNCPAGLAGIAAERPDEPGAAASGC